jgi:hypothetical protein
MARRSERRIGEHQAGPHGLASALPHGLVSGLPHGLVSGLPHGLQDGLQGARLVAEPVRPVTVPGLVVLAGGAVAFGDLGLDNLVDLRLGQVAPLDLTGAQARYGAGDMRVAALGGRDWIRLDSFGVADRAQRRAQA